MKQYLDILNRILTEVDHLRTVVVPERRHEREIPAGAWCTHLERVG